MSRRLVNLTLDTLEDLPRPCRQCVFWELDPVAAERACASGDPGLEKEAWVSQTLLEWGSCGQVASQPASPRPGEREATEAQCQGYILYAPPHAVPRAQRFPTAPVSADAVLLMTARVLPQYAGGGLARMLLQATAKDLSRRGVRAVEAFGLAAGGGMTDREGLEPTATCLIPADLLLAVGFKTVRQHPRFPRLRLELKTALSWREDVELALERILGTVRAPVLTSTS